MICLGIRCELGGGEGDEAAVFRGTVLYVGEPAELIRTPLRRLFGEFGQFKRGIGKVGKQRKLL